MVVFISGGFGFLGGRIAQYLASKGHEVIIGTSKRRPLPHWLSNGKISYMDWFSDESLRKCSEGVDCIVHVAGVNASDCSRDPVLALEFNGVATARFVQAALTCNVKKFIYFSTAHVYSGKLSGIIDELSPINNLNPYATSHYAGERAVLEGGSKSNLDGIVIRLSNAFGAPVEKNVNCWGLLINEICRQILENGEILLKSNGNQQRDFIPISNVCKATEEIMTLDFAGDEQKVFNLGSFKSHTVLEMAKIVQGRSKVVLNIRPEIKVIGKDLDVENNLSFSYRSLRWPEKNSSQDALIAEIDEILFFCRNNFSKI